MKTKEEVIKEHYENAGFVWEEVKTMVDMYDGTFKIKEPLLKHKITGYSKAYSNNLIKAISLTDNGELWLSLASLQGLVANNGWIKIESEDDLPNQECYCHVIVHGNIGMDFYDGDGFNDFRTEYITHYKNIEYPKPPIY